MEWRLPRQRFNRARGTPYRGGSGKSWAYCIFPVAQFSTAGLHTHVIDPQRRLYFSSYSLSEKEGPYRKWPACRVMGMRAFGRRLPIGDFSIFIIDSVGARY